MKTLDDYLTDPIYMEIYLELRLSAPFELDLDSLEYMRELEKKYNEIDGAKSTPSKAWEPISTIQLKGECYYYFMDDLLYLLKNHAGQKGKENFDASLFSCYRLIATEHECEKAILPKITHKDVDPIPAIKEGDLSVFTACLTNNFDEMASKDIVDYFKSNLADKGYINYIDLCHFLILAFDYKKAPENKFTLAKIGTKAKVRDIFYIYYSKASQKYGNQTKYAALLGDYFEGYETKNVSSNFKKSIKSSDLKS